MVNSGTNIHSWAYTITLMLLAASIPLSKYTMSVTEFMLLGLWLWSGFSFSVSYRFYKLGGFFIGTLHLMGYIISLAYNNLIDKFGLFFRNKPAIVFTFIYFVHILGLLYTSDFNYALKDLRVKLPLILLPVVIATMEKTNSRRFRTLMIVYSIAVLISTIVSVFIFMTNQYMDIREISPFISPIRLGLNISFAFFIMIYFIFHDKKFRFWQILSFIIIAIWFLTFLFLLEAVTSIIIILIISIGYLFWRLFTTMVLWQKSLLLLIAITIPVLFFLQIRHIFLDATTAPEIEFSKIDKMTALGNPYIHDTLELKIEDGKYVGLYICYDELKLAWNKRSEIDYHGKAAEGQLINTTLIRYLTSKDLRKDAAGVNALTNEDVYMIEQGVANYNYNNSPGLRTRILKMVKGYEVYNQTGNPSGSSIMQRLEYLKASFNIIENNFIIGVGTGDLEGAFNQQFTSMNSTLESQYMYHAHNQFLGIFVALGLLGFIVFVVGLFYPAIVLSGFKDYYFSIFFFIMIISMFSDDTLETQAGVTLFTFFYSILLFGRKKGDNMPAGVSN
ncbi:MAG: O-antigen ligase family protein [Bacteroidetes bacterium]|nr:O-antigen ligase family protein [Bacteroidota bacterium]MBL6943137.1 O-antigen ligase family protein [Bacteroidales bacterium]